LPVVAIDGARIWFEERGAGSLVLLVHGGLFDPMDGARFWIAPGVADDLIAAGYRVCVPDRRYSTGRTTSDFRAHSWDREAADLAATLEAVGGGPAHVLAGSNGCSAAILLALLYPALTRSLTLCWPATPDNAALAAQFARSADAVASAGPAVYLAELRAHGVPRPEAARPGFPFGAALLHDEQLAQSFLTRSPAEAARSMRATADALLPGDVLRGVSRADAALLAQQGLPVTIIPTEPEDPWHLRATARALADATPGSRLTAGTPVAPAPGFAAARALFARLALRAFSAGDAHV
jgi:pimeloyl-ACP methyl ester carboxylesterase